jgi:hypothetical protein
MSRARRQRASKLTAGLPQLRSPPPKTGSDLVNCIEMRQMMTGSRCVPALFFPVVRFLRQGLWHRLPAELSLRQ